MSNSPRQRHKFCIVPIKKPPDNNKSSNSTKTEPPPYESFAASLKMTGTGGGSGPRGSTDYDGFDGGIIFTSSSSSAVDATHRGTRSGNGLISRYYKNVRDKVKRTNTSGGLSHKEFCKEQQKQLQQIAEEPGGGDSAKINCKLNEIFIKRLRDIECTAEGDADLKLLTYQEWIEMLLKINENIISNMQELELEVSERLECVQQKANINRSACMELAKTRRDILTLLKVIHNGYHCNNWDINDLKFETITHRDVLGTKDPKDSPTCCGRDEKERTTVQKSKGRKS